jgi:phosphoribosyl-AMP cyclohydrolase / phosphoribosyl-ATP pyrophosphohydrolase
MKPDFEKYDNKLIPVIIQDFVSNQVLMQAFMNEEAYLQSIKTKRVTFFSRSKNRLWTKGESSGNFMNIKEYFLDCDSDSLLFKVLPMGPVCHTGQYSCYGDNTSGVGVLSSLEAIISNRKAHTNSDSYVSSLIQQGINKIAQKVGEESVELIIEAKDNNDELFLGEAADLLFHYLILLAAKGFQLKDVETVLAQRFK